MHKQILHIPTSQTSQDVEHFGAKVSFLAKAYSLDILIFGDSQSHVFAALCQGLSQHINTITHSPDEPLFIQQFASKALGFSICICLSEDQITLTSTVDLPQKSNVTTTAPQNISIETIDLWKLYQKELLDHFSSSCATRFSIKSTNEYILQAYNQMGAQNSDSIVELCFTDFELTKVFIKNQLVAPQDIFLMVCADLAQWSRGQIFFPNASENIIKELTKLGLTLSHANTDTVLLEANLPYKYSFFDRWYGFNDPLYAGGRIIKSINRYLNQNTLKNHNVNRC
ncbi:MAG: hypothetical protein CMK59_05035 [Proteobacteria bacterium]|nr:hypothetical protein [Pseudomonadota bacterium]